MKTLLASLFAFVAVAASAQQLDYRFDEVRRKVSVNQTAIAQGQHAKSGDKVQTGWFSYALIASESSRAKFEIFSATDVQLADGTAGVLLSLERGRIRAAFDKITGSEPRVVKTPGALLAVRGTKFDVNVDAGGQTTVDVFEGIVEVRSPLRLEPLFVHAGEQSTYGRREAPVSRPMPEDRQWKRPDAQQPRGGQPHNDPPHGGEPHGEPPHGEPHNPPPPKPKPPASF